MKSYRVHVSMSKYLVLLILSIVTLIIEPTISEARGGFGGFRGGGRSFGGRSFGSSRSFGGSRNSNSFSNRNNSSATRNNSFGGSRSRSFTSGKDYQQRYGVPRKSQTMSMNNGRGGNSNYVVHSYGGRGDGFMAGYMMGMIPWYWHTPFHPAFYYSQPVIVNGANGTREVYPGTFSIGSLLLILLCLAGIIFIIYAIIRSRRQQDFSTSSFG